MKGRKPSALGLCVLLCLSCSADDCSCGSGQPQAEQSSQPLEAVEPQPVPEPDPPPPYPKPGFVKVEVNDSVPICVFPSYQEHFQHKFLEDVGKQSLKPGDQVVFGAFAPWCVHESCDDRPSLQCQAKRDGNTIWITSKYWGGHKEGSQCTEDCRSVAAGCDAGPLEKGTYSVQHGELAFTLKIPSTLRDPCFGRP